MRRALIAASGGVDSSVAAYLMGRQGFACTVATIKMFGNDGNGGNEDVASARIVADRLGMPHHVFDFSESFQKHVIDKFIASYQKGETPNPCIDCNRYIKFDMLLCRARELGMAYIATGHYVRVGYDEGSGRYLLRKAADKAKDQSYVLYTLTQEQLQHAVFPLGDLHKPQVRAIAAEQGFPNAEKHDSQDICFVSDGDYAGFIRRRTGYACPKGRFVDTNGHDLGEHRGIIHYTVGQRRGLGISAAKPLYVRSVCVEENTVVVGTAETLYAKTLIARDINFISVPRIDAPRKVRAKIRYRQPEQPATVWQLDDDTIRVTFDSPQRAITTGQAVVLYDGDNVVGGGVISENVD